MIACMQCGYANPDDNKFCQNCGKVLELVAATTGKTEDLAESSPLNAADGLTNSNEELEENITSPDLATETLLEPSENIDLTTADGSVSSDKNDDSLPALLDIQPEPMLPDVIPADLGDRDLIDPITPQPVDQSNIPTLPLTKEESKLAVRLLSLKHAGLTDVGKQRDHNEDTFAAVQQVTVGQTPNHGTSTTTRGLFVVCDGMGGHAGGEVASAIAIDKIRESFQPFWLSTLPGEQTLQEIIGDANQAIYALNEQELRRDSGRMGTTLVVLSLYDTEVAIAHVGDSRIYQVTANKLEQITRDHEVANRLIDSGIDVETALSRPDAHQLTQALGPHGNQQINPAVKFFQLSESTLFLLCSDGLCDNDVVENNWQTHLLPLLAADADLESGVKALIDLGNTLNGHDNITAILVNCQVEKIIP